MSSKKTVEEYLTEEIKKSGYPLEIEVSSILRDSGEWVPLNQQYYLDDEQNEGRTIDIASINLGRWTKSNSLPKTEPFNMRTDMVIECKKSNTHAWVFFTVPEVYRAPFFSGQTLEFLSVLTNGKFSIRGEVVPFFRNMATDSLLHYDRFERIAIVYDEINLSGKSRGKERGEIFEAVNQIAKYTCYDFERITKRIREITSRLFCFYFPVIVFDGKMYECIIEENIPKLFNRNHILLRTSYRPKYSDEALNYGIDVVQREEFPKFIQEIQNDIYRLAERISERRDKLVNFTEACLKAYQSSIR